MNDFNIINQSINQSQQETKKKKRIYDDLLLESVLERFASWDWAVFTGDDGGAPSQPRDVPSQDVEQHRLRNVVGVVAGDELVGVEEGGAAVEGLATEDAAEGAVVFEADEGDDLIHGPAVEVLVGDNLEGEPELDVVPLYGVEGVVAVPGDALVDGQEEEVEAVVVDAVQPRQHVRQHRRVLAAGGPDGDALTAREEAVGEDELVDFVLEGVVEALPAYLLKGFGSLQGSPSFIA